MTKYILLHDQSLRLPNGHIVYRIKAVRDFDTVRAGELGGYIEAEDNLSHDGYCWVGGDAIVYGDAEVKDDAFVGGLAYVGNYALICGNAVVRDCALVGDWAEIRGCVTVEGHACISGETFLHNDAYIGGEAHVSGDADIGGQAKVVRDDDYLQVGRWRTFYRDVDGNLAWNYTSPEPDIELLRVVRRLMHFV